MALPARPRAPRARVQRGSSDGALYTGVGINHPAGVDLPEVPEGTVASAEFVEEGGDYPGEVVGLVLEFSPHNEEQAWG